MSNRFNIVYCCAAFRLRFEPRRLICVQAAAHFLLRGLLLTVSCTRTLTSSADSSVHAFCASQSCSSGINMCYSVTTRGNELRLAASRAVVSPWLHPQAVSSSPEG